MEAVLPLHPRLVIASLHGEPRTVARDVCAACFAGGEGAWAVGDRSSIEVHVRGAVIEVPNDQRSPLRATHALRGVALGKNAALFDMGTGWLLWRAGEPPLEVARLPLAPSQTAWSLRSGPAGVTVQVRDDIPPSVLVLPLLRVGPPRPPEVAPLDTPDGKDAGFVERAERGVAVIEATGRRVPLGDTRAVLAATLAGDTVVAWTPREIIVALSGGAVERVQAPDSFLIDGSWLVWLESARRRVRIVDTGVWQTVWQAHAGDRFGGGALADGATPIRLEAALGHGHLAVVERVQGPDCGIVDQVHLLDLERRSARTVVDDEHLRLHVAVVDDGFGWIEADADRFSP